MTIGERIKTTRKAQGLSQQQLGKLLGVSSSMIGQYEIGHRNPKLETLERIADALSVTVPYLIGKDDLDKEMAEGWVTEAEVAEERSLPQKMDQFMEKICEKQNAIDREIFLAQVLTENEQMAEKIEMQEALIAKQEAEIRNQQKTIEELEKKLKELQAISDWIKNEADILEAQMDVVRMIFGGRCNE